MLIFVLQRLFHSVLVVLVMALLVFFGVFMVGDPVAILIDPMADQIEIARATKALGLDKTMWAQFWIFLSNALQGDLGRSFVTSEPALKMIVERMPATLELAFLAIFISVIVGLPLGMIAGINPDSGFSRTIMGGSILGLSLPSFWIGLMLILLFAVQLGWLPSFGRGETVDIMGISVSFLTLDGLTHLLLPATNLALFKISLVIRLARAGTREVLMQDYIKFARAKGLSERRIIFVHLMKNILIPIVTVIGLELGGVIALAVVTETIFSWPGMGKLLIDSIESLDRPLIVAYMIITVLMFVTINFFVDVIYTLLDPRIKIGSLAR
ncbi:MAG: ABC transporter permease [Pseudomonadales bacterium]|jgi:peptide/nickel transport system permease protein|tara:strand:+ start:127 stop:1104 length:978 start_codon:yes stop_codon:yes gene_type:complete